ncbi:MAG: hypothetical protein AB7S78_13875 [Candidatus Omnitrophota bacterium]
MKNKRGSVLIITLGFVVAFTLLGMASLHYAMVQNEETERQKASMEAFWLADGAVEQAKAKYPGFIAKDEPAVHLLNSAGETDFNRYYDVYSGRKKDEFGNDRLSRYIVLSYGKVNGQLRFVKAEIDGFSLPDNPLIARLEPINSPVPPVILEKIDHFAQESCDDELLDVISPETFTGVTCLKVEQNKNITVPIPSETEKANVLVIDVTKINENSIVPTITFDSVFNGIILVKGNVKLNETNLQNVKLQINGTLLVDGLVEFVDTNSNSKSDSEIVFDSVKVDEALKLLPFYEIKNGNFINNRDPRIISWEEVSQLDEQI